MRDPAAAASVALSAVTVGTVMFTFGIEQENPSLARKLTVISTSYASLLLLFLSVAATSGSSVAASSGSTSLMDPSGQARQTIIEERRVGVESDVAELRARVEELEAR